MTRRRVLLGVFALLVLLLAAGAGSAWWFVRQPWPQTSGTLQVAGIQQPVEVIRDEYGVPHIYAENRHDLFFAQGYVHAQDRFWQMDFQRRVGLGRLSEVLGEATLDTDKFLRTIGTNRAARQDLEALDEETRAVLEAYTAGVNAYIESHRDNLPLEYRILGVAPEPWEPLHTMAWVKMMQWDLNGRWSEELLRARLIAKLGAEETSQLLPGYLEQAPLIVSNPVVDIGEPDTSRVEEALAVANVPLSGVSEGLGSNNWVVGPSKTATGRPMLANDPHLRYGVPAIWYEMGLHGPEYNVVGATLPGVIGVVIGHNENIAWGVTNLAADVQDLYVERLNPNDWNEYEVNGEYVPFDIVREEIRVKGEEEPVVVDVRISRHGPLINDVVDGLDVPVAFKWYAASNPTTIANTVLQFGTASNWEEFTQALRMWDAPMQNFVYADADGNIGYYGAGAVPIRTNGNGSVPVPGWNDDYEWAGTIPFEELPHTFNPQDGFVATANQKPVPDSYPHYLAASWASPNRARRIVDSLSTATNLTLDDMAAIQADDVSLMGQKLAPLLLDVETDDIIAQRALAELENWDYHMQPDAVGAGIFAVAYWQLVQETVGDEIDDADMLESYLGEKSQHMMFVERLLQQPNSKWWDDVTTPEIEDRDDIVARALTKTVEWWGENHGDLVDKDWTWGAIHTTTFAHNVFGEVTPLNRVFNVAAGPTAGSTETPQANGYSFADPFTVTAGPGYRQIVDVGAWENSRSVIIVGQSGHVLHPHYDDFVPLWLNVEYHPMYWERDAVENASQGESLRLEP